MAIATVTAKLSEIAFNLRRVRKGQGRPIVGAEVETVDLALNDHAHSQRFQSKNKIAHRLGAVAISVVNRLHQPHVSLNYLNGSSISSEENPPSGFTVRLTTA